MKVLEGFSHLEDASQAIDEATADWNTSAESPSMIFVFHSTRQNPQAIAAELASRFPEARIAGCTTAGEWRSGHYEKGSLVLAGIVSHQIRWSLRYVEQLDDLTQGTAKEMFSSMMKELGIKQGDLHPERHFCIALLDGMTGIDGQAAATMADEMGNIPFIGGLAGDDLKFESTHVIANDKAVCGGGVFVMAESDVAFHCIKHQHFNPGLLRTVVTEMNETQDKVLELDGLPATRRYAQLLGLEVEDLGFQVFSEHPVMYRYGSENFVRSIAKANEDGSLTFYSRVEEGMVLNLCEHLDMLETLDDSLSDLLEEGRKARLVLMFNCVLRSIEANASGQSQALAEISSRVAGHVIGFDTYGELWNGLHINQTLVAIALSQDT